MDPISQLLDAIQSADWLGFPPVEVPRNEFLTRAGEKEGHIYWIEEGAVRAFFLTGHEEHTIRLGYRNSFITALRSYLTDDPATLFLQTIRKTKLRKVPKSSFLDFVNSSPDLQMANQKLYESLIVQQLEREIDLLTHSPLERYQRVLTRSPQLFQEIPAKYIASYLRMTPETLSRLRNS